MQSRVTWLISALLFAGTFGWLDAAIGHEQTNHERLSVIGPAPEFSLTTEQGTRLTLENLRGKVVVVTFIYTACADTCPLLTTKMVGIQKTLGDDFGSKVHFVSITVDPERDRPEVLQLYAAALGCDPAGWAFVTGTETEITDVARAYGVYKKKQSAGDVDHNLLTSIIDQQGMLRVQYMGDRFDPHEFMDDLQSLLAADPAS